ncbi:helix-turn-helix transcriptional regulator [Jannaschia sp. Os4]|uniref:helix-turn-helix domain-containing protein n=1 Tax=Jannaschia sp. Os4 TaxID=2807617 RepID=UPI00193A100C|nr:AraC family transcriptional regulator [Jannaschia sp. Os4]MBM2578133.1 helix-turn-helix transcriptional regulator [Jannaschia sp. Os4]
MTQQTASSLADFYRDPASPYAGFPQEHRSGGSMPVRLLRVKQGEVEASDPAVPDLNIIVGLKADIPFAWDIGDGWMEHQVWRPGEINVVPPHTTAAYRCDGDHEILILGLKANFLSSVLDDHRIGTLSIFEHLAAADLFRDEPLRRTAMQLWTESARTGGTSDLLIDGLTQVLLARLLDKAGALRKPQPILPLSPAELARIDALVEHRMGQRLTVEDLARALDMPRWTFADAFKTTTGDTPHSYVTAKRVEKACEFLRLGDMPLAEIAYATGFASQSHMTDTFRRVMGTTPGKWRTEVRG